MWLERIRARKFTEEQFAFARLVVAIAAAAFTIVLVLARCSPLNESVNKDGFSNSPAPVMANPNPSVTPHGIFSSFTKGLVLLDSRGKEFHLTKADNASLASSDLVLSADPANAPDLFSQFVNEGSVEVELNGVPASDSTVVFKVQPGSVSGVSLAQMEDFAISLQHVSKNTWSLELSNDDFAKTSVKAMLASLQQVTLKVAPAAISDN